MAKPATRGKRYRQREGSLDALAKEETEKGKAAMEGGEEGVSEKR